MKVFNKIAFYLPLLAAVIFSAGRADAVLHVYEGFGYPDGDSILGKTGGFGWADAWQKSGNAAATELTTSPGSTYSNLPVSGNKATATGATSTTGNGNSSFPFRNTTQTFGDDGTTLWVSFLSQRTGDKTGTAGPGGDPTYERVFSLAFFNGGTENFAIGELSSDPSDTWALNPTTAVANAVHTTTPLDTLSLLLLRIDYGVGAGMDNASLWMNPDLSLGEAGLGVAHATIVGDDMTFNRLRLSAGGSQSLGVIAAAAGHFDELRVGSTFADMLAIPEPGALSLAAIGLMVAAGRRRGRRQ